MIAVEVHPSLLIGLILLALTLLFGVMGWIMVQLYEMHATVRAVGGTVSKELTPNAGSSIKDTIDRLERKQEEAKVALVETLKQRDEAFQRLALPFVARIEALEIAYVSISAQLSDLRKQATANASDVHDQIEASQPKEPPP